MESSSFSESDVKLLMSNGNSRLRDGVEIDGSLMMLFIPFMISEGISGKGFVMPWRGARESVEIVRIISEIL